jgi:hypothetical protein
MKWTAILDKACGEILAEHAAAGALPTSVRFVFYELRSCIPGSPTGAADWQAWLKIAARFHAYSFNNTLQILAQRPGATRHAGCPITAQAPWTTPLRRRPRRLVGHHDQLLFDHIRPLLD